MVTPIQINEFILSLKNRLPTHIAVANSAGPDSTCLLFLLSRLFPPSSLLSLHVAHNIQSASSHMASVAAANAEELRIPHRTLHVPWGVPPFPDAPLSGPVERIARDARYNLLFNAITLPVSFIALGHHADDQLETVIMRLARGSSLLGAAGMHPLRRWGMGSDHPLASFGYDGLNTFILRPLLSFPKSRILATCHANQLRYVTDPTNLDPHLTPRNAIRHCLDRDSHFQSISTPSLSPEKVHKASLFLQSIAPDILDEKQRLHLAVSKLATMAEDVQCQVTSHLDQHALPSPIGTLLLSSTGLLDIVDPDVRFALILRVIRYVSFHPWGSLPADAHRRRSSLRRVIHALWPSDLPASQFKRFTAGGGVLWTPAIYNPNKPLRLGNQCSHSTLQHDDSFCWLASRMPPFAKNPHQSGAGSPDRLVVDLTHRLRAALSSDKLADPLRVLYDCRFLIHIHPSRMPVHVRSVLEKDHETSVKVLPFTHYYWPKVVLQRDSHPDQILAVPQDHSEMSSKPWISIHWVRPLDAT